jgi:FkbM family methyltransferase
VARAAKLAVDDDVFLQSALHSRQQELDLYLTRFRGASSIFKPNLNLMNVFPEMERYEIESTVRVQATTLDHLYREGELPALDFLKIDVQGAELEVLKGGKCIGNTGRDRHSRIHFVPGTLQPV